MSQSHASSRSGANRPNVGGVGPAPAARERSASAPLVSRGPAPAARVNRATQQMVGQVVDAIVQSWRPMSKAQIAQALGYSDDSASAQQLYRYLDIAVAQNMLTRTGVTRGVLYSAAPKLRLQHARQHIEKPLRQRPVIGYNSDFLDSYVPNETFYLSADQREVLRRACAPGSFPRQAMDSRTLNMFMADLAYNSSRMEGNTYDYGATVRLIEEHKVAEGKSPLEAVMLLNHYNAGKLLVNQIHYPPTPKDVAVTGDNLQTIHAILCYALLPDARRNGQLRDRSVAISNSSYLPLSKEQEIKRWFDVMAQKASEIEDPFEASVFLLVHLPYLQAFDDCNKRTARVACNIPLLRAGVLPMSWHDTEFKEFVESVFCVYECNAPEAMAELYVDAYQRSVERFALTHHEEIRAVAVIARYRNEVRQAVRSALINSDESIPASVDPADIPIFMQYVSDEVNACRTNRFLANSYGIQADLLATHAAVESASPRAAG